MDRLALLNRWQHDFPLVPAPFAAIATALGSSEDEVIAACRDSQASGALSRIGGVWAAGAGGAAMLCALAVPAKRLEAVAAQVDALPGVNHNYEREHRYNLWFVITGHDAAALHGRLDALERDTGLRALRLPMQRVYRIDLGFDLERGQAAPRPAPSGAAVPRVAPIDAPLAALVEDGLPLVERPYAVWAERLGLGETDVLQTLRRWLAQGTLRRFGVVVRHHELGFDQNAMTVFDVPDDRVDACGAALARQPGVTLCYRRARADGWPFNLYCMVHGRERDAVRRLVDDAARAAGVDRHPHEVLFSLRRFKQQGASYFRASTKEDEHAGA
jgi:DNA-binding Lrp family transcriptional regulator